jgi:hypothetical protein
MSGTLTLNLKAEYFEAIRLGEKTEEYRLYNKFWRTRIEGAFRDQREFQWIKICLGYPKADDHEKILMRPWRGYKVKWITHPLFGPKPVAVFAIRVNREDGLR